MMYEAIARSKEEGQVDRGCRKCLACTIVSVLSLINNLAINSELTIDNRPTEKGLETPQKFLIFGFERVMVT